MRNCLIVDDSSTIRKIVRGMFTEFGFKCIEAENGQKAFDICQTTRPDVIMLDWNMPIMTGIEFMHKLNEMHATDLPNVIFCTTESDISFINQALNSGAVDYIMKPFEKEMLRDKLLQLELIEEAS
jgi:two-component system chemotaxis response regulator CheY